MTDNSLLRELQFTPNEELTDVTVTEGRPEAAPGSGFKPPELAADLIEDLVIGKSDLTDTEKQQIKAAKVAEKLPEPEQDEQEPPKPETEPENEQETDEETEPEEEINPGAGDDSDSFTLDELITPETAIDLFSFLSVFAGAILIEKFAGVQIDGEELAFTPDEKKLIRKPLKKCFQATPVKTKNPWVGLSIVVGTIFATKGFKVYSEIKEKKEKQQAERYAEQIRNTYREAPTETPPPPPPPPGNKARQSTRKPGEKRGRKPKPKPE